MYTLQVSPNYDHKGKIVTYPNDMKNIIQFWEQNIYVDDSIRYKLRKE